MPYRDKSRQLENNKLWKRNKKNKGKEIPKEIPQEIPFIHDIMRFELLFDTLRMRELLSRKTNFNLWMNKQLDVLDELKEYEKIM